ncbi:MAG: hypothetical protein FWE69_05870 [Clostridiales bacterium]|nr:hypothetical protein [Clostridiales bacterium]
MTELEALRLQKRIDSLFSDAIGISPANVSGTKDGDLRIRFHEAKWIVLNTPDFSIGNIAFIGEYADFVKIKSAIQETAINHSAEIIELLDSYCLYFTWLWRFTQSFRRSQL